MKKGYVGIIASIVALLIWACGEGSIDPVTDDELLMVGKWDPTIEDIQEACDACLADPDCKREYNKFAKEHGCVPIDTTEMICEACLLDPECSKNYDKFAKEHGCDADGEEGGWEGTSTSMVDFEFNSSSGEEGDDDEDASSASEDDWGDESSSSRRSSSSSPVYSAASASGDGDSEEDVVREQSSSSAVSGKSSSSSAIAYSATTYSSSEEDDPNIPPTERSSSSKGGKSSSSSAMAYSAATYSSSEEENPNIPPSERSSSSKGGKSSSSSAIAYSATTYSSSEEDDPNIPPESRSSSSSKPKNSSSSSVPIYIVSSSSSNPTVSSSSRAARSSSSGAVIEMSSIAQSSSSAKSSSSIAPRSSSSRPATSSSSQNGGGTSQGVVCGSQLTGTCKASEKTIVAGDPVTYTYTPSEEDLTCDGDIVWYTYDEGAAGGDVHYGGNSFTTTYTKSGKKTQAAFEKGTRRIPCDPVTVSAAPPANCSCTPTRTSSGTNDLFDQSPVNYKWTVSGCTVAGVAANDLTYSWSGGNTSGTGASATVSYTSAGTFTPTVRVTTSEGMSTSFTCGSAEVKNTPPQNCSCSAANLTSTSNDLFNVDQVNYSWTVSGCTGNGLTYSWSGGNVSGSSTSVTGTYTSAGNYTPKVTVKTATNASTTVTCGAAEVKNSGPTGCECTSITRKSSSNDLLNVSPVVYEWKATGCQGSDLTYTWGGTGISGNGSTATGTFTAGGSYIPTLRVSTARGGYTDVQCVSGTVKNTAPSNCSCTASLRSDYNDLYKNSPVEYDWSVTGCTGNNLSYAWSNGVSGNTASVTGSYTSTGSYTPKVTVTNMGGASTSVTCETGKVVNYAPPTCSVNDISHVYIGSAVSVVPSSLTGCDYDSDGCNYAITGGTTGGTGDSGYKGGKITGLIGEPNAGDVGSYTLTLTNKIGIGYCNFDVAYTGADYEISSKGGSVSVSNGTIIKISEDLTSGGLRCWHGWQSGDCTVNIESSSTVTKSIGSCNSGDSWGYIELPLSSLNSDRVAVITFTNVSNGTMSCGVR